MWQDLLLTGDPRSARVAGDDEPGSRIDGDDPPARSGPYRLCDPGPDTVTGAGADAGRHGFGASSHSCPVTAGGSRRRVDRHLHAALLGGRMRNLIWESNTY